MSLNGLDDPKVQEAYEAAVAEPGGWFLLKYASRDEVELLGRGSGGVVEVRNNVTEYEETSPLYGFLRYRRRNVLIKFLPEDCSRLIQARVAVHFNAVCDRFSPYDTIFEITEAKELRDTRLSAACSLHAASGSTSSSTSSLRRRRLMEIAEEEEDEQQQRATKRQSVAENDDDGEVRPKTAKTSHEPALLAEPVTLNSELAESPEESKFTDASEVPNFVGADDRPVSSSESEALPRLSSQSGRPDLYPYSSYNYGKPKVKLGPRPSLETNGRPRTAGSYRPVSQMPSGFKLFGKGSKKEKSKEDFATTEDTPTEDKDTPPVQDELQITDAEFARPTTSSGVSISGSAIIPAPPPAKPTISPEKARLMKAMKLREKKKKDMAVEADVSSPPTEITGPSEGGSSTDHAEDNENQHDTKLNQPSMSNADSGIGLDVSSASMNADQSSDLARTDSHPDSPVIASSEPEISTKASSLSESTDDTLHPKDEDAHDQHEKENVNIEQTSAQSTNDQNAATVAVAPVSNAPPSPKDKGQPEDAPLDPVPGADTNISEKPVDAPANDNKSTTMDYISNAPDTTESSANIDKADEPLSPTTSSLKIPKSKFSTQDLRSAANAASSSVSNSPPREIEENKPTIVTQEVVEKEEDEVGVSETKQQKRKTNIEPIKTQLTEDKDPLSDDEDLMDELHDATLHEAKPMTVAKSPVTPVFPSPTKSERSPVISRTVSNPVHGKLLAPGDVTTSSARSVSSGGAAYLHKIAQQPGGPTLSRKGTVGSSISQRIKALEKLSASTGETLAPAPTASARERPSSAFFSVRKSREPSRSPSVVDRTSSINRANLRTPPSRSGSRDESPDRSRQQTRRGRSTSVASRLSVFEANPLENDGSPGSESISVTARIVRDPSQNAAKSLEPAKDLSEFNPVELQESPLLVDHQRASPVWSPPAFQPPKETLVERRMSKDDNNGDKEDQSRRSSLSVVRDFINDRRKSLTSPSSDILPKSSQSPTRPPSTHQGKRLSISSRRSSFSRERENVLSPSATTESSVSGDETKSSGEKMKSRAGRFMRRLSSLSSSRGKTTPPTVLSPTVQEEHVRPATTGPPSIVSFMGDVNVQFPDNLLWKRRNMCLDSQGFLILSALPSQSSRTAQGTKRYHLSDFRAPYIPDVEVQELPNSVVLDLVDGSSVQLACMDRTGQVSILSTLQEAHAKHATPFAL
ncbi:hypothetical protein FPSE_00130 [Fusarium pseudograminearum CS3096]|uniref:ADF-H domain-containing protein n=1 Tax=Fusarium pseudograminearum (strain CS3096) TaxID=1028729 RepID=K3V308_FUSPC|nr:hypothetical protein FPSE_00130 [Fusarium pseudograminearum CS3096]EKJ79676.1 hypothetical protein FPSE_00130 [Fusarium pseudograminearum CS3096]